MIHTFLLTVYLGTQIVSNDMYFRNIDSCRYFAERLNKQPSVPNRIAGEDVPLTRSYTAVCEIRTVDPKRTKIY